jgi:hypothetical protein
MSRLEGAGDQAFTGMRVLVIPAATVTPLALDWSDFREVASHFRIKE